MASEDEHKPLRSGWTTGACATAAVRAAYGVLLSGSFPEQVSIRLPKGHEPTFDLDLLEQLDGDTVRAGIVKDAGDDPDVTHGALIIATVKRGSAGQGVRFFAGQGVGTVTKAGLPIPPGEAAINPVPRQLMTNEVVSLAKDHGVSPDLDITISVPTGEVLAKATLNPRLGILGGISILGTTGVVTPYSCSAWIHSIHRGVDVAKAAGLSHIAACTGSTSEKAVVSRHGFEETALIDMGDFIGGFLKYLRKNPLPELTLGGGFAKMTKYAQGAVDLHSKRSRIQMEGLADWVQALGAEQGLVARCRKANTGLEVLTLCQEQGLAIGDLVAQRCQERAAEFLEGQVRVSVELYDRKGGLVGRA